MIVVKGGVVQDVYASKRSSELIWLVDWDNIEDDPAGETHAELIDPADISELDAQDRLQIEAELANWKRDKYTEGRSTPRYLMH